MRDHRDVFNILISASVEAMLQSESGRRDLESISRNHTIRRESVASFLWSAYRDIDVGETLEWCNLQARKEPDRLVVSVVPFTRKSPQEYLILPTRPTAEAITQRGEEKECGAAEDPTFWT